MRRKPVSLPPPCDFLSPPGARPGPESLPAPPSARVRAEETGTSRRNVPVPRRQGRDAALRRASSRLFLSHGPGPRPPVGRVTVRRVTPRPALRGSACSPRLPPPRRCSSSVHGGQSARLCLINRLSRWSLQGAQNPELQSEDGLGTPSLPLMGLVALVERDRARP